MHGIKTDADDPDDKWLRLGDEVKQMDPMDLWALPTELGFVATPMVDEYCQQS